MQVEANSSLCLSNTSFLSVELNYDVIVSLHESIKAQYGL